MGHDPVIIITSINHEQDFISHASSDKTDSNAFCCSQPAFCYSHWHSKNAHVSAPSSSLPERLTLATSLWYLPGKLVTCCTEGCRDSSCELGVQICLLRDREARWERGSGYEYDGRAGSIGGTWHGKLGVQTASCYWRSRAETLRAHLEVDVRGRQRGLCIRCKCRKLLGITKFKANAT